MDLHLHDGDIHLLQIRTRLPFRYGIATMTSTPHAFVRLRVQVDGQLAEGLAADHLPPRWFTKDPSKPLDVEVSEMLAVVGHALEVARDLQAGSVFAAWQQLYADQAAWGRQNNLPPLLTHFGTSLVERALIDAVCRLLGQPFARLLRENAFGIRLGEVHPALAGQEPAELLPEHPRTEVIVRHTVGLVDPLVETDIAPEDRLDDGLPQSLAACIQTYGLRHFKIKVSGALDQDRERVIRVADVIEASAPAGYAFSLDGNEQFHTLEEFRAFWEALTHTPKLQRFFEHLLFVEQPFHRDVALQPAALKCLASWTSRPPLIIDESDGEVESLPQALLLGYDGTSHKNCKGVLKGIANACLLSHLQQQHSGHTGRPLLLSGEDLANIGPVALLQDLTVAACLGITSVERNGHHYFAGLSMFPGEVQQSLLHQHGDLYRPSPDGWPTLSVRDGRLQLGSVLAAPFGVVPRVPVEHFATPPGLRAP